MARQRVAKEPELPPGPSMTDAERAELDERLAKMFSKPNKGGTGEGFFLLWMERDETGSPRVMMWHPETEAEIRGANLFHDAAHGLGEFAKPVKKGKPVRRASEEDALIKAILQNRDDHTGYLVYADYLTENGNTQGDFIRVCTQMESLTPGEPEFEAKSVRTGELIEAHAEEWFAPLGELGLRPDLFGRFTPWLWLSNAHGVIESISIDRAGILPENSARLFAAAPFLRKLEFEKGHLDPAGLAKVKQLPQIEELELSHTDLTADGLRTLLKSKYLTGLKTLGLSGNAIGNAGAEALAAWPGLARLGSLDVSSCQMDVGGISALAQSDNIVNLSRLRLGRNTPNALVAHRLFTSRRLKSITELELGGSEFDATIVTGLHTAAFAKTLQHLDLEAATFQPGAFVQFTRCQLPALRQLKLNSVDLRPLGADLLARAAFTETLEELSLDNARLRSEGAEVLASGMFLKLKTLDLSRNRLNNRGGVALANAAESFPALTSLKLWDNRLGPEAIVQLARGKLLANLTDLDLSGNKIGTAGAMGLANSKYLKKLTSLIVDEKAIGKKGKQALLDRFGEGVMSFR